MTYAATIWVIDSGGMGREVRHGLTVPPQHRRVGPKIGRFRPERIRRMEGLPTELPRARDATPACLRGAGATAGNEAGDRYADDQADGGRFRNCDKGQSGQTATHAEGTDSS